MSYYFAWQPYVSVAERRRRAEREVAKLKKRGQAIAPVRIEGRKIAKSFWGQSWCTNLERYSDFENRLPRGRTYVRNGSVVDLQIAKGEVAAMVAGSDLYKGWIYEGGALSLAFVAWWAASLGINMARRADNRALDFQLIHQRGDIARHVFHSGDLAGSFRLSEAAQIRRNDAIAARAQKIDLLAPH